MPDSAAERLRALARVVRGERAVEAAGRRALQHLLDYGSRALRSNGYDAATLSAAAAGWRNSTQLAALLGEVEGVFLAGWGATARSVIDPEPYATRHLEAVWSRLAGVPDAVFDNMRTELAAGRLAGEGIPLLASRIQGLLSDEQRWAGRARTIARTEVIGANNAGAMGSAAATAELLGEDPGSVVKEWLSTIDTRTRETHLEANGMQVKGLDTPFVVGGSSLDQPGDPSGDPGETINCRCTVLFHYPGDPDYPDELAPGPVLAPDAPTMTVQYPGDVAVDAGPSTATEAQARGMTPEALMAETTTRDGIPKSVARAELARRGLTAAVGEGHEDDTTVWVALLPAPADPVHAIGPEDPKHATLLFLGEAPTLPAGAQELLASALQVAANAAPSELVATVTGVESLGDEGARVWMLDADVVPAFRTDLLDVDTEVAGFLNNAEQYPTFTAHVTIGYVAPLKGDGTEPDEGPGMPPENDADMLDEATETAAAAVTAITFDRLALWWAGTETTWQLAAAPPEETPVETDPPTNEQVAAALAVLQRFTSSTTTFAPGDPVAVAPETTGPAPEDMPTEGDPFYGILWPEDTMSGDGRMVARGSTVWRDLPLPFMAQDAQAPGHDGAVRTGRIDTIERDETTYSVPVIRYAGVWDTSPIAVETARQVETKVARGVSVDGDDVTVELRGSDGQPLDPMVDDFPEDGVVVEVATSARVAGATLCSIPAFQQAYVANGVRDPAAREPGWNSDGTPLSSGQVPEGSVPLDEPVAVAASGAPERPAWSLVASAATVLNSADFANPGLTEPTRLTVTDDGRVYGHLATWGVCHIGIDGVCVEPPVSATNYAYFATGSVPTEAGYVAVGQLTMDTGHASMRASARAAVAHYDNTGSAVADVSMGQDDVGIWIAGRLRPETTARQVHAIRAAGSVSGDWRDVGGHLECVAALICNVPGFPIPVPAVAASGARATAMVASGIVRDGTIPSAPAGQPDTAAITRAVYAQVQRMGRAEAAAARLRLSRASVARRKLEASATAERRARLAAAAARL